MPKRTSDKPFLDTNVLVYAFGAQDDSRAIAAMDLLASGGVTGVQMLNEFVSVARRKLRRRWPEIIESLAAIQVLCPSPIALTVEIHEKALGIAQKYGYPIYDSLAIAAALEAGCTILFRRFTRRPENRGT